MHYSCICTFISFFLVLYADWCFSACLSLSRIVCIWHPSAKLLHPRTLFVMRHLLLTLLHFMSGSVMRRPVRTSRRTSPNVELILNATLSSQIFPILLYPLSFMVGDGNLCVRYLWVVPPWSYRSSTPICIVSIPLYLSLLHKFKVYVL